MNTPKFEVGDKALWRNKIPVEIVKPSAHIDGPYIVRMDIPINESDDDHKWLVEYNELSVPYQRPRIYALVNQIDQLTRALLAVADTPHAQASVLDTLVASCLKYRETLDLDATIAQFKAMDVSAFVSAEDAK